MKREQIVQCAVIGACLLFCLAMVSPTLELSREKIQRAKCASNLKRLATAWAAYLSDYHGFAPDLGGVREFEWGKGKGWMDKLFPYVSPEAVAKGPAYPESANAKSTEVFRCPALPYSRDGEKYLCSYIFNIRLYLDSDGQCRVSRLKFPWKVVILYDRNKWTGAPSDADMTDEWGNNNEDAPFADPWGPGGLWYYHLGGPDFSGPHSGGYNILFADWHVKWFSEWDSEHMTRHAEIEASQQ